MLQLLLQRVWLTCLGCSLQHTALKLTVKQQYTWPPHNSVRVQDVQALFSADDSSAVLSEKILALQNAAGIKTKLVNPRASGVKTVTLSGWAALVGVVSLVAVSVGGVYIGYNRWLGREPAYVMVSKSGDV